MQECFVYFITFEFTVDLEIILCPFVLLISDKTLFHRNAHEQTLFAFCFVALSFVTLTVNSGNIDNWKSQLFKQFVKYCHKVPSPKPK